MNFFTVRIVAEEGNMKSFNGADIYQTILSAKKYFGVFIREVIDRHGLSYPGKKEARSV